MQAMLLHGEQYLEVKAPLKATGRLLTTARVLEVQDKGKAAVVVLHTTSRCADSGEVVAENEITSFMRGAGGFGKQPPVQRKAAAVARNEPPRRESLLLEHDTHCRELRAVWTFARWQAKRLVVKRRPVAP